MIFHSLDYVAFLLLVLALYWSLSRRLQNVLLLVCSYVFYGYVHPWFLMLLAGSTIVDYFCGRFMREHAARKRLWLWLSLSANLGLLGTFKYFDFFSQSVAAVLREAGLPVSPLLLDLVLPVGISFYTFQTLSYTIDIYRGRLEPRTDFVDFALFVSFFPQLVAGPIERATELLPQVEQRRIWTAERALAAMQLLSWGFFKKLVIADNVAVIVNKIFALEHVHFGLLVVATFGFCMQIYADFSAYTDIARGSAKLLGFELMKNFDHPYLSQDPRQFWARWHISLSSWFRDYVYVPLGGNRVGPWRHAANLLITFLLSGLWHGASWNFVLWGAYHATLLILYELGDRIVPDVVRAIWPKVARIALFFALTNVGWLIFREQSLERLGLYLAASPGDVSASEWSTTAYLGALISIYASPLFLHAALSAWLSHLERTTPCAYWSVRTVGGPLLVAVLCFSFMVLRAETTTDFIYFQF